MDFINNNPQISVIIPVYNAEKYLKKCLDSVVLQTFKDFEVIAIDDGSSDSSIEILREYANNDSRFVIESKKNEGPGLTRNRALDKAKGNYVVFLDSDDYLELDYFKLLNQNIFDENPDVIFINLIQEDSNGKIIKYENMSRFKSEDYEYIIGCQMTGYMPWGGWRKVARRELIEKKHLRYTDDVVGEEAIFSFELLRNASKITFIEKRLYHYVNHPNSQSKNPNGSWEITLRKMTNHLEKNQIRSNYEKCLNAFAFTVLISYVLRTSKNENVYGCMKLFNEKLQKFERDYGWNINKDYLRWEVRILLPIVKMNLLFLIVLAAKVVRR